MATPDREPNDRFCGPPLREGASFDAKRPDRSPQVKNYPDEPYIGCSSRPSRHESCSSP